MPVLTEELTKLKAHRWQVSCLGFNPDGSRLASGGWDKELHVWDLSNLEVVTTLKGAHKVPITSLSWHKPNGLLICTGSADNTAVLWNPKNGQKLVTLYEHQGWVLDSCFSPSGSFLATASWDKTLRIWDPGSGTVINNLHGHAAGIWSVDFHHKSSTLCTASEDGTVKLWDARTNRVVRTLSKGHSDAVYCAKWSPDGAMIASGSADNKICIWEPSTGAVINTIYGHTDTVKSISFNPNTKNVSLPVLASAGDFSVRLSDPRPTQKADIISLSPHLPGKEVEAVAISPDGSLLVSGGRDGLLVLMTLFVPTIVPKGRDLSFQKSLTSSVLRKSRAVRERSYMYDVTDDSISLSSEKFRSEEDLLAEIEADALDRILSNEKPKSPEHKVSKLKRMSRLDRKNVDLADHATVRRKGPSARDSRKKRVQQKVVDLPTMIVHLTAAVRAYRPEEPASSSESEDEETTKMTEQGLLIDVTKRVDTFTQIGKQSTLQEIMHKPPAPKLSLIPENVQGKLKNRRHLFESGGPLLEEDEQNDNEGDLNQEMMENRLEERDEMNSTAATVETEQTETEGKEFLDKNSELMPGDLDSSLPRDDSIDFDNESLVHQSGRYSVKADYLNTSLNIEDFKPASEARQMSSPKPSSDTDTMSPDEELESPRGQHQHPRQQTPFIPTLDPPLEVSEDNFAEEIGSGDEYGDDIPLSMI